MPKTRLSVPPLPPDSALAPQPVSPPSVPVETVELQVAPREWRPGWLARWGAVVVGFLVGSAQNAGWTGSVTVHALALLLLALIFVPQGRKDPPQILTAANALESDAAIGEQVAEFTTSRLEAPAVENLNSSAVSLGGSSGQLQPDLSLLTGQTPSGLGRGMGAGRGDGVGRDADERVAKAGGRGGVVQIALLWDDRNDLDLHVLTPGRQRISYLNPKSSDGGELDVDMNVTGESTRPVENIRWLSQPPRDGKYQIQVHYFNRYDRGHSQSPFRVVLRLGDQEHILKGTAQQVRNFTQVATFEIKNGRAGEVKSELNDFDESSVPELVNDPRRKAQREEFARQALTDALSAGSDRLKIGMLRRVMERFPGTEAAAEAQRKLSELN